MPVDHFRTTLLAFLPIEDVATDLPIQQDEFPVDCERCPQLRLHESGVSAMKEIGRSCRVLPVPWQCCPPDRVKTVSKLFVLEPLGLALSEKQVLQIVENIKKRGE